MRSYLILAIFASAFSLKAQSVLTLDAGTTLGVLSGADLCANIINGTGTLYGAGTICSGLVSIQQNSGELPLSFELLQNYPNPFNPSTMVQYQIPSNSFVSVKLYDQLGRESMNVFEGNQLAGYYSIELNAEGLSSGIYYLKVNAGGIFKVIKISLIK